MKYTRYDLKKKRKKNYYSIVIFVSFFILAILIVALFSPYIFKMNSEVGVVNTDKTEKPSNYSNYELIQFGSFEKLENAKGLQSELSKNLTTSYIVQDNNVFRVVFGIYGEEDVSKILKDLKDKKIEYSQMNFKVDQNDLCNKEISEAIDANLQIINALSNKDVKSIQTEDLKKWGDSLKVVDSKSINFSVLQDIKSYINKFNSTVSKSDIEISYNFILKELKSLK